MTTRSLASSSVAWARLSRCNRHNPCRRRQQLSLLGWVKDVSRTGQLLPANPIQESFGKVQPLDDAKNNAKKDFPDFTQFHPHHLKPAFVKASRVTQTRLTLFQQKLADYLKYFPEQKLPMEEIVGERHQLSQLIEYLVSLQNLYYTLVGSEAWKRACSQIPVEANWESDLLRQALEHLYQSMPSSSDNKEEEEEMEDRRYVVYKMLLLYRLNTITALDSVDVVKLRYRISELDRIFREASLRLGTPTEPETTDDKEDATETSNDKGDIATTKDDVATTKDDATTTHSSKATTANNKANERTLLLQDMAEYFILKQDLARSRGMDTYAEWILKDRMVDRFKLLSLLKKIWNQTDTTCDNILVAKGRRQRKTSTTKNNPVQRKDPQLNSETASTKEVKLDEPASSATQPMAPALMFFELESVLETMFRLVESLFSVVIDEEEHVHGWHPDVRLFHVYEDTTSQPIDDDDDDDDNETSIRSDDDTKGKYLGSFYLDPLERPDKEKSVTNLVLFMGSRTVPILATHAVTDDKDGTVTLNLPYVAALFKGMGGAIQSILAGPVLVGFHNRHVHLQEVDLLWKNFMEHWLMDDRVLTSLAQNFYERGDDGTLVARDETSASDGPTLKDHAKTIRDVVRYTKALALSDYARMSAAEIELFSTVPNEINPNQQLQLLDEESTAAAGKRLHAYLDKKKVTSGEVLFLLRQNSEGYPMSFYRHVLSDLLAARLFLKFQSLLPNERLGDHADEYDPMDQLAHCQSAGLDFRRRFAQPRPPWRVLKDLEEFCGDKDVFSAGPLDQIYEWDG